MAQDLPVAWQKVTGAALKRFELSVAEKKLIQDMSAVIDQNIQAALSMTLVEKP
jgi:hypothetical protein